MHLSTKQTLHSIPGFASTLLSMAAGTKMQSFYVVQRCAVQSSAGATDGLNDRFLGPAQLAVDRCLFSRRSVCLRVRWCYVYVTAKTETDKKTDTERREKRENRRRGKCARHESKLRSTTLVVYQIQSTYPCLNKFLDLFPSAQWVFKYRTISTQLVCYCFRIHGSSWHERAATSVLFM